MVQLTMALGTNNTIQFVGEVARGSECGCFCPVCRGPLVAKKGMINEWHFAHESGQERPECFVGALNLFSRLMLEHLQEIGTGITVQGLKGITLCSVQLSGQGGNGGLAQLSDDRQIPVFAHLAEHQRNYDVAEGADCLTYTSQTPTLAVLKDRQTANTFISRYARLFWRGAQPQTVLVTPRVRRRVESTAVCTLNLQPITASPILVYPLKDGTTWIMYKNCDDCFVLRQWPEAEPGWVNRFPLSVGTANLAAGAIGVKDFLSASATLRSLVRESGLQCNSLDSVQRLLDRIR